MNKEDFNDGQVRYKFEEVLYDRDVSKNIIFYTLVVNREVTITETTDSLLSMLLSRFRLCERV